MISFFDKCFCRSLANGDSVPTNTCRFVLFIFIQWAVLTFCELCNSMFNLFLTFAPFSDLNYKPSKRNSDIVRGAFSEIEYFTCRVYAIAFHLALFGIQAFWKHKEKSLFCFHVLAPRAADIY